MICTRSARGPASLTKKSAHDLHAICTRTRVPPKKKSAPICTRSAREPAPPPKSLYRCVRDLHANPCSPKQSAAIFTRSARGPAGSPKGSNAAGRRPLRTMHQPAGPTPVKEHTVRSTLCENLAGGRPGLVKETAGHQPFRTIGPSTGPGNTQGPSTTGLSNQHLSAVEKVLQTATI